MTALTATLAASWRELAAENSGFWADWPKFVPGWLAFGLSVFLAARALRTQWLRRALGPDPDAVRNALAEARCLFEEVCVAGGRRTDWFLEDGRREVDRALTDLVGRVGDKKLATQLCAVATACREVFAEAPPRLSSLSAAGIPDVSQSPEQRDNELERLNRQVARAQQGLDVVGLTVDRLNKVERRVTGR